MNSNNTEESKAGRQATAADIDQPYVLFLVGARLNRLTWPGRIRRINQAMSAMQRELLARPELGCARIENWAGLTTVSVQYWRTREQLLAYARSSDSEHLPAWREFNRRFANDKAFGIWHEIHEVSAAHGLYVNMSPLGLGRACHLLGDRTDQVLSRA
ncbi:MAG: DUF4188 domain-containing protein [Acidimicrobiia bacterium]|nr:DUF4188 domain-containing protein [Acidimicrobiia bacterium]